MGVVLICTLGFATLIVQPRRGRLRLYALTVLAALLAVAEPRASSSRARRRAALPELEVETKSAVKEATASQLLTSDTVYR